MTLQRNWTLLLISALKRQLAIILYLFRIGKLFSSFQKHPWKDAKTSCNMNNWVFASYFPKPVPKSSTTKLSQLQIEVACLQTFKICLSISRIHLRAVQRDKSRSRTLGTPDQADTSTTMVLIITG